MPQNLTDYSEKILADLRSGGVSRGTLGGGVVLGQIAGLPPTVASYLPVQLIAAMSAPSVTVSASGTPAAVVGPGAAKPTATSIATGQVALAKHAGLGTFRMEDQLNSAGVAAAVASVLGSSTLLSFEAAAQTALDGNAGSTGTAATWAEAVALGQAKILAAGGRPGLVSISTTDYPKLVLEVAASSGFSASPESPVGQLWGSAIHVSAKQTAGSVLVIDRESAAVVFQHESSPLIIVDTVSQADTNTSRIVTDLLAVLTVSVPALVAKITKTP